MNQKLDLRSKTIIVSGEALKNEESQQGIKGWYEGLGGSIERFAEGDGAGSLKVTFTDPSSAKSVSLLHIILQLMIPGYAEQVRSNLADQWWKGVEKRRDVQRLM